MHTSAAEATVRACDWFVVERVWAVLELVDLTLFDIVQASNEGLAGGQMFSGHVENKRENVLICGPALHSSARGEGVFMDVERESKVPFGLGTAAV